jgi:hypothetical protein
MRKILWILLAFSSCAGQASKVEQQDTNVNSQIEKKQTFPASTKIEPYFIGEGGKNMSLGILVPESQGLNANQSYLTTMVQGVLVANISKYSAIDVLDRVSLDKVITETLDPTYKDNLDIVRLGHVSQVGNYMTGKIIKTSIGYSLQLNITDTTPNAKTIAAYTGNCTVAQFDDYSAINKASLDLLEQMGVQLTQRAKNELEQASTQQYVNAQTALSQGIVAQQRGTVVEALNYYYNSANYDPSITEATSRLSVLSSTVSSGNIGENVRNDIQRRNEWLKVLNEAETFFKNHLPFEIIYNTNLSEGNINYQNETVDLSFSIEVKPSAGFRVLEDIRKGLVATGRAKEWGVEFWPLFQCNMFTPYEINNPSYGYLGAPQRIVATSDITIIAGLFNDTGKQLSTTTNNWQNTIIFHVSDKDHFRTYMDGIGIDTTRFLINDEYINSLEKYGTSSSYRFLRNNQSTTTFRNVNANDITDNLIIKIISVNGIDANQAGETGYIKILSTK